MLRRAVIAYGVVALVVAVVLALAVHAAVVLAVYLALNGALIVGSMLFERGRYRPRVDHAEWRWLPSGERFVDSSSGHLVEVHYNPTTGERDYVDAGPEAPDDESRP